MIWTIMRKEWLERVRDGQLRSISIALALLLVLATIVSVEQWKRASTEQQAAQARDRQQWLSQGSRNPHSAAHFGVYAFKPRLPLSFLDPGLDPYTGSVIWVEAHYQNPGRFRPAEEATALQRLGQLTPAAVLYWFVPLLVVLMSFSAFTSERENGTLRLSIALGVSPRVLAAGKALGVAAATGCVLAASALLAGTALALLAPEALDSETRLRLLVLTAAYLTFLAVYALVGLTVSAIAPSSRVALAILLGLWAMTTFVAPKMAAEFAEARYPSPSASDFWRQIGVGMRGADGHSENDKRILELKRQTMQKYGVTKAEDLPVNFEGLRLQAGEEHGNELFDRHYGELWAAYESQQRLHHLFAFISPPLALRAISMAVAGTDLAHLRDFSQKTELYRRELNRAMNLNVASQSRMGEYYYFAGRQLWESIAAYRYEVPGLRQTLGSQRLPLAILGVWLLLALVSFHYVTGRVRIA